MRVRTDFTGTANGRAAASSTRRIYAVEFAFACAAGEGKTDGIEEIAAANAARFLQICGDFLETLGGERSRF